MNSKHLMKTAGPSGKGISARTRLVCALVGWIALLSLVPLLVRSVGGWVLLASPILGAYFVSWLGMLRHELWHGYIDGVDNRRFFRIVCFSLCLEPETYRLSHGSHHSHANTERDMQMYPEDYLTNRRRARRQFVLEFVFGNLAWEVSTLSRLHNAGLISTSTILSHLPNRLVLPVGLAAFFVGVAPEAGLFALANFLLMFWSGSVMTRHNQWLQHLGIIADGTAEARNLLTRNLKNETLLQRFVNFLNHDDSVAHTYHHTEPNQYTRLNPELGPAQDHVQITLAEYASILLAYARALYRPASEIPHDRVVKTC